MEVRLQKWGNSDGIRIPSIYLKNLNLKTNDIVNIENKEDKIIITKYKKNHLSFDDRVKMFEKLSNSENEQIDSYDWGDDVGKELIS